MPAAKLGQLKRLVDGREMTIRLLLEAPRKNLYRCSAESELMKQWFAPLPWTVASVEVDLRAGGASNVVTRRSDGAEFPNPGLFLEVVPNERLVLTDADKAGWKASAKPVMTTIVTFADEPSGTRYNVTAQHWTVEEREAHKTMGIHGGWTTRVWRLEALAKTL